MLVSFIAILLANAAEADLWRCFEKVLQLGNRVQLCFVHVDHHLWMINLLTTLGANGPALGSFLTGNTWPVQAHTSLDKAAAVQPILLHKDRKSLLNSIF